MAKNKVDKSKRQRTRVLNAMYIMNHSDVVFMFKSAIEVLNLKYKDSVDDIYEVTKMFLENISKIDYTRGAFINECE